jgi:hypothetical protein
MAVKVTVTGGLRFKQCGACGDWHEVANWPANHTQPLAAPSVIRDDMPPTRSMVDGSIHESKRGIRKTYEPSGNAEGVKYTEVGNDPARLGPRRKPKPDPKAVRESLAKAQAKLANGEVTKKTYETKVLNRPGPI